MVVQIYKDTPYWTNAVAYEYWCDAIDSSTVNSGEEAQWPVDRDETAMEKEQKILSPLRVARYIGFNASRVEEIL